MKQLQRRLQQPLGTAVSLKLRAEIGHLQPQLEGLEKDVVQIQARMAERHETEQREGIGTDIENTGSGRAPGETHRDFLIRTGKITPFSRIGQGLQRTSSSLAEVMFQAEEEQEGSENASEEGGMGETADAQKSHQNLLMPGFGPDGEQHLTYEGFESDIDSRPKKRQRISQVQEADLSANVTKESQGETVTEDTYMSVTSEASADPDTDDDFGKKMAREDANIPKRRTKRWDKKKVKVVEEEEAEELADVDDGNENLYQTRLQKWMKGRKAAREKARVSNVKAVTAESGERNEEVDGHDEGGSDERTMEEWHLPHPTRADVIFEGGLRIPGDIFPSLFDYQKTGVQWLWELYTQQVGGIIGDEMGLGKTIQIISFLAGLHHSNKLDKPIIVVTPATVMKQWVNEFHRWWPPLRVSILHTSGSGMLDMGHEIKMEDALESRRSANIGRANASNKSAKRIVDRVLEEGHVLVTTYSGLQTYADLLIPVDWGYAVLDEGHKIRNPNTSITIYCKELRTSNRVILSGTPMQNNLTELWSLFDFIFPMRLGTLVNFRNQFEIPIKQGGYANASNLQVETALKCAEMLKDTISPYLLQRFKVDVAADLPKKSEQVLFCRLTKPQREAYETFLGSEDMKSILNGRRQALYGIDILRKICNHPDLTEHRTLSKKPGFNYGSALKAGKMQVVRALLELWRDTGHKTLLFAQHRIMLDILEKFLKTIGGFNYRRMDGNTQIKERQDLVDEFNKDMNLHVFLLTTKVGGLGVNLTGADRVIIYDPDWNPSTDMQARERAWRLGQKREVMIYRLMTAGTIEEKIYHRQIFKQFLTNKILRDPKQRQSFQLKDLHDLFTLGNEHDDQTETGGLFKGAQVKLEHGDITAAAPAGQTIPVPFVETDRNDDSHITSIIGISHRATFAGEEHTGKDTDANIPEAPASSNPRLLSTIFARSGVHSALEHDAIINGSNRANAITADPQIIAREAKRVAAAAAQELQRAHEAAKNVPIGTPTWTGITGIAGRPEDVVSRSASPAIRGGSSARGGRGGAGPASSSILANLSARQKANDAAPETQPKGADFIGLIRDYLRAHGGAVYTQMLVDHFNRFCTTPTRTMEFKEMLKTIATLDHGVGGTLRGRGRPTDRQGRGGRARWVLKDEYK